jgi:hypothetical protein
MTAPLVDVSVITSVQDYRRVARMIVRSGGLTIQERSAGLIELARSAQAESDDALRRWGRRVIWEESREFFGEGDPPPEMPPDPFEHAQRTQRSRGFAVCPTCLAPLASDADFERSHHLRADHRAELERRERAVSP